MVNLTIKRINAAMFLLLAFSNCFPICFAESVEDDDFGPEGLFEELVNFVNPHSVFYNKGSKKMIPVESTASETDLSLFGTTSSQQEDRHEYVFYKRLVKVLLSNIDLKFNHPNVTGLLLIEGTVTDLEILQDFVDGKASIREADRILSNIMMEPKVVNILSAIDYTFFIYDTIKENIQITLATLCCIISYLWLRNVRWSPAVIMFSSIMVIFVISFFIVWYQMIQEAQIKHMVLKDQLTDIPASCQPDKMNMWDKLKGFIHSDDSCEKYYKSVMSNPILEVTPAIALMHLLTIVVFHPVSHAGVVIGKFITDATANTPFVLKMFYQSYLYLCLGVLLILLPIIFITGSLSLGIGPFSIISFGGRKVNSRRSLKDNSNLERIEDVQKVSGDVDTCNNRETPAILCTENCSMADGDKIRNIKCTVSKHEICGDSNSKKELCASCGSKNENQKVGGREC